MKQVGDPATALLGADARCCRSQGGSQERGRASHCRMARGDATLLFNQESMP